MEKRKTTALSLTRDGDRVARSMSLHTLSTVVGPSLGTEDVSRCYRADEESYMSAAGGESREDQNGSQP